MGNLAHRTVIKPASYMPPAIAGTLPANAGAQHSEPESPFGACSSRVPRRVARTVSRGGRRGNPPALPSKYRPVFPHQFDSIGHARDFSSEFFDWYNHDHRHSGIGLHTAYDVHHGLAERVREQRANVLTDAYATHPERFVRGTPEPPKLPNTVWINRPAEKTEEAPTNPTQ